MEKNTCFPLLPGQGWNFLWLCILNKAPFQAPMIHHRAHAHMPYVRRPCQDAHAPFWVRGLQHRLFKKLIYTYHWGFLQSLEKTCTVGHVVLVLAVLCANLLQKGTGSCVYIRDTETPVKPPCSSLILPHPTPIPVVSIFHISSPNAPYTCTKLGPTLGLFSHIRAASQPLDTDPWLCFCHYKRLSFRDGAFTHGCLSREKKIKEKKKKRIVGSEWKIKPGHSSKFVLENW